MKKSFKFLGFMADFLLTALLAAVAFGMDFSLWLKSISVMIGAH